MKEIAADPGSEIIIIGESILPRVISIATCWYYWW